MNSTVDEISAFGKWLVMKKGRGTNLPVRPPPVEGLCEVVF
jgi:hypothetical protein